MGMAPTLPRERPVKEALRLLEAKMADVKGEIHIRDSDRIVILAALAIVEALDAKS